MRALNHEISRRILLIGCALTPCMTLRAAVAKTSPLAEFLRLSAKLTGRANLSAASALIYMRSLGFDRSKKNADRLARRIVADWYSGQTVESGRMICVDYTGALMWDAMRFARPGGVPGEAGSWALAPTSE
ncbi:MAG: hypothetical protein ACR65Z_05850 [Methylocystis sp.]